MTSSGTLNSTNSSYSSCSGTGLYVVFYKCATVAVYVNEDKIELVLLIITTDMSLT